MKMLRSLKTRCVLWVWNHSPNCAEMSRLASRSFEHPPSLHTLLKTRLHYLICAWCKRYFTQLRFLHETAPHFGEHTEIMPVHALSAEARWRIVQRLRGMEKSS